MKPILVLALALAALAATTDAAALLPDTCSGACSTSAEAPAFLAPVATLSSGSTMSWRSLDTVHEVDDGATAASCFDVVVPSHQDSAAVRFVIGPDGLHAQRFDAQGHLLQDRLCAAQALPDGSFALAYRCLIHPEMRGVLVVTP